MTEPIKFEPLLIKKKIPKAFALAILYLRISPNKNTNTQKCIYKKVYNSTV